MVWDTFKEVIQDIHDKSQQLSNTIEPYHYNFNEDDLVLSSEVNSKSDADGEHSITTSDFIQSQQSILNLSERPSNQASYQQTYNRIASIAEYLSPEQMDLLTDDQKKSVVNTLLSKVSVFFDAETKQHRLEVEFSEEISGLLESLRKNSEEYAVKKSGGSAGSFATERDYMMTVE